MYNQLYNLLETYLYSGDASQAPSVEIACDMLASIGTIFIAVLPFLVVWKVIRMICG